MKDEQEALQVAADVIQSATTITPVGDGPFVVGETWVFRCVTNYLVGRIAQIYPMWIVLEDASWIPDTGRWHEFMAQGRASEVEPCPDGKWVIAAGAVVDCGPWPHKLPRQAGRL